MPSATPSPTAPVTTPATTPRKTPPSTEKGLEISPPPRSNMDRKLYDEFVYKMFLYFNSIFRILY